jgi:dihydrofolate synthase / folylpolyglutamate synthase
VRALLAELGDPQAGLRGALIAGTNGKGSTSAFLESILRAAGLRTGLMPKPHLSSYTERIQVNAQSIGEAAFAGAVEGLRPAIAAVTARLGPPTEFEILTALALGYLAPRVDRLVCEVGMGGRLDATNVLDLGVAVITNVALDHQQYLGDTIEAIAGEKAAIIKSGDTAISGCTAPAQAIVEARARSVAAELWQLGHDITFEARPAGWAGSRLSLSVRGVEYADLAVPLLGSYQPANAALAVAAAHALGVSGDPVRTGLAATRWPGRLEVIADAPRVLIDGGHNPAALDLVVPDLVRLLDGSPVGLVFGAMADKDLPAMLRRLEELHPAAAIFTRAAAAGDRAASPSDLARQWRARGARVVEPSVSAVEAAREVVGSGGVVFVCGSLYLVGEVRAALLGAA